MGIQDQIGHRGETLFRVMITRKCRGRRWFYDVIFPEKYPTIDFHVELLQPRSEKAHCYVQVKATEQGLGGDGPDRMLKVRVSRADVKRLRRMPAPTYVVGIDVTKELGEAYIMAIDKSLAGAINGLPARHRFDCRALRKLWLEVDAYWKAKNMLMAQSTFSIR
jgi:hypothetical protein